MGAFGNTFGKVNGGAYVNQLPSLNSLNFRASTRSELSLIDSFGNNASILPAYLYRPSAIGYYMGYDNGGLDVGASDFTIAGWVKGEAKTASVEFLGKGVGANLGGRYAFYSLITSGYIGFEWQTSSGNIQSIASTVDITSGWHFVLADVNQATKKVRLFIDNIQIGSDTTFAGTFPALDNKYAFIIGGVNFSGGNAVGATLSTTSHAETYVYNKLLTPTEQTSLYGKILASGVRAFWPMCCGGATACPDASGNSHHLIGTNLVNVANTRFAATASSYALDNGYSEYSNGNSSCIVPFDVNGTEVIPTLPVGYVKTAEGNHAGSLTEHNLANSAIAFTGSNWDRSDVTIFNAFARSTLSYYNSSLPKQWHVSELNNLLFQSWANVGYKGLSAFKITDHSYKSRKVLNEIISYNSEMAGGSLSNLMAYCKDYVYTDTYEDDYIYWKYTPDHLVASNGLKVLKWDSGAQRKILLSVDGGLTYQYSLNIGSQESVKFGYIFNNGNILVAFSTKIYLSTDNLTSLAEITVDGLTATPDQFFSATRDRRIVVNGVEELVWGTYCSNNLTTEYVNIKVFCTTDNGATVNIIYSAGVTDPPLLSARHIHGATYRAVDNSYWIYTGDSDAGHLSTCNVIRLAKDVNNIWSAAKLFGDTGRTFKIASLGFYNNDDNVLIGEDDTSITNPLGLFTVPVADMGTRANWTQIYKAPTTSSVAHINGNDILASIVTVAGGNVFLSSKTGVANFKPSRLFGLPDGITIAALISDADSNGWSYCNFKIAGNDNDQTFENGTIMIKIK